MDSLPAATVKRVMAAAGATRISPAAVDALREHLEREARAVTERALREAAHAGRQTVQAQDVQRATQ